KPTVAGGHAKLHRRARGCHWQIESVFELDLLCLRETELAGDIGNRLLPKHDCSRTHGADDTGELKVLDGLRESLQAAAILLEETQAWSIDLAIDQQSNQSLV